MRFAYFPGCVIPVNYPHLERLTLDILKRFDVEVEHPGGFSCCPEPIEFAALHPATTLALSARNLAIAGEAGLDIITACNGCALSLKDAASKLEEDEELLKSVNDTLADTPHRYGEGRGVKVYHFLEVFKDMIGRDKIIEKVARPLTGLRVATHTGCHLLRPRELMGFEADPDDPVEFDKLISYLGAKPVEHPTKTLCCGISHSLGGTPKTGMSMVRDKMIDVHRNGADCMAVGCPSCLTQLDRVQRIVIKRSDLDFSTPVLYYTQLLGLAMGMDLDEVRYRKNRVRSKDLREKIEDIIGG